MVLEGYVTSVRGSGFTVNKLELDLNTPPAKTERKTPFINPIDTEPKPGIKLYPNKNKGCLKLG